MNLLEKPSPHHGLHAARSVIFAGCFALATCALTPCGLKLVQAQSAVPASHAPKGWFMAGSKPDNYQTGVDQAMVENGLPSAFLKSAVPDTGGFGTLMQSISAKDYAGKRVRLHAWVRSQDISSWAGLWMRVDKGNTSVAFDNMQNRPIKGTQMWEAGDVVLDIPQNATRISMGILLTGAGEVWMNDVTFEVVGNEVPVTDLMLNQKAAPPSGPANLKFTE